MNSVKPYFIYKLFYQEEPKVIYIGKTHNVDKRLKQHLSKCKLKYHTPKNNWIKDRNTRGWELQCKIIDTTLEKSLLNQKEILWISFYRTNPDFVVKNGTDGGDGFMAGNILSPETKNKLSETLTGRTLSDEHKSNLRKPKKDKSNMFGKIFSTERRNKISEGNSKSFKVISPSGKIIEGVNLRKFCRENNLSQPHMHSVITGKRKSHKGYTLPQ